MDRLALLADTIKRLIGGEEKPLFDRLFNKYYFSPDPNQDRRLNAALLSKTMTEGGVPRGQEGWFESAITPLLRVGKEKGYGNLQLPPDVIDRITRSREIPPVRGLEDDRAVQEQLRGLLANARKKRGRRD